MIKTICARESDCLQVLMRQQISSARPYFFYLCDFVELTKPRIVLMSLFTVAVGYWLSIGGIHFSSIFIDTLIGVGLVAAGGSSLNQLLEWRIDSRMRRTCFRPIPSGRVTPCECAVFGLILCSVGFIYLVATVHLASALIAALTIILYVCIYTPLKRCTIWNTLIGAIPGALPPVIGWFSASGWDTQPGVWALFALLFIWQIPHFLAIAWIYREDYARGGLCMLPSVDRDGDRTATIIVLFALALIPIGFIASLSGTISFASAIGTALSGIYFFIIAVRFARECNESNARRLLRASVLYLSCVLILYLI